MGKVAHYGAPIVEALAAHGLAAARDTLVASLNPDDVKFFLKQQQKCLADSQGSKEEGIMFTEKSFTIRNFHGLLAPLYNAMLGHKKPSQLTLKQ